ncbi:TPA: hypothetical protein DDZ86_04470 [Candidatus Dependentiae bacterium]|nr:hypothetical protein [Candidatus Dependentiae bacterium]
MSVKNIKKLCNFLFAGLLLGMGMVSKPCFKSTSSTDSSRITIKFLPSEKLFYSKKKVKLLFLTNDASIPQSLPQKVRAAGKIGIEIESQISLGLWKNLSCYNLLRYQLYSLEKVANFAVKIEQQKNSKKFLNDNKLFEEWNEKHLIHFNPAWNYLKRIVWKDVKSENDTDLVEKSYFSQMAEISKRVRFFELNPRFLRWDFIPVQVWCVQFFHEISSLYSGLHFNLRMKKDIEMCRDALFNRIYTIFKRYYTGGDEEIELTHRISEINEFKE